MLTKLGGFVRRLLVPDYAEGSQSVGINNQGCLLNAFGLPAKTELVRLGNSWHCSIATGSAFTHVAAWPTTRAEIVLYNGESAGGKSYVIDQVWAANVATSIAAASAYTLLAQIVPGSLTAPADNSSQLITSLSGRGTNYSGKARRAVANTDFMVASKWQVIASVPAGPSVSIGLAVLAEVNGGLIVPPGAVLGLNLVAGTATGTASIGFTWHETQLPLG